MDGHAIAPGNEPDDLVPRQGIAAAGEFHQAVVHSFDDDAGIVDHLALGRGDSRFRVKAFHLYNSLIIVRIRGMILDSTTPP